MELPLKDLHFSSLQQANKFGGLHHVELVPEIGSEANILADSPSQIADTISSDELELVSATFIYKAPAVEKEPRTV